MTWESGSASPNSANLGFLGLMRHDAVARVESSATAIGVGPTNKAED